MFYKLLSLVALSVTLCGIATAQRLPKTLFPEDFFFRQRAYPNATIDRAAAMQTLRQAQALRQTASSREDMAWQSVGPVNIGGRVVDIEIDPTTPTTYYVGAAAGGIFKSTNAGESWQPIFDNALSLSIGDMALAPGNPQIMYVGTGEANGGGGSPSFDGVGIYKTTNGGASWQYVGLEDIGSVGRIVVHPTDPEVAYVGGMGYLYEPSPTRGIYKTTNGGATWQNVLHVSDSTGCIDLQIHPQHPDTLYAAMWERMRRPYSRDYSGATCGVYRSFNGGTTWTRLNNGLPNTDVGRIGIALSPVNPAVVYAFYADSVGYFKGIYKSTNHGESWVLTNDSDVNCASYGWWFGKIFAHPTDADKLYALGFDFFQSDNGGFAWQNTSAQMHVDHHALAIHPATSLLLEGNDGGVYRSFDGGYTWQHLTNLPITQFYTCEFDAQPTTSPRFYGGAQDNGTNRTLTGNIDDWDNILGGDGFVTLVDPTDSETYYAEYQYGGLHRRSVQHGDNYIQPSFDSRWNWNTPFIIDPTHAATLYCGGSQVFKSPDRGDTWQAISPDLSSCPCPQASLVYGTITTLSASSLNPNILYAGTDDGNVWRTLDGGANWLKVSSTLPKRWVTHVETDPFSTNIAYVTISGYKYNEYLPHVFRTTDNGLSWADISGNLPEAPVNDLVVHNAQGARVLYVATDVGVFQSINDGQTWEAYGNGLPLVPVMDLTTKAGSFKLAAATYGRSMYVIELPMSVDTKSPTALSPLVLTVSPNPVNSTAHVSVQSPLSAPFTLQLYSTEGRFLQTIIEEAPPSSVIQTYALPIEHLPQGSYIVRMTQGDYIRTERIIKL